MNRKTIPPKIEWVKQYIEEKGYRIDPEEFYDYQEMRDWRWGRYDKRIKDWQAAIRTYYRNGKRWASEKSPVGSIPTNQDFYRAPPVKVTDKGEALNHLKLVKTSMRG